MYYVLYFLAGAFAANALPHSVKGLTGESHRTPFGAQSSAVVNVIWGSVNVLVAWALWHWAGTHRDLTHTLRYEFAFGLGGFVLALVVAQAWSKVPAKATK